jgi:hypothetical protein
MTKAILVGLALMLATAVCGCTSSGGDPYVNERGYQRGGAGVFRPDGPGRGMLSPEDMGRRRIFAVAAASGDLVW